MQIEKIALKMGGFFGPPPVTFTFDVKNGYMSRETSNNSYLVIDDKDHQIELTPRSLKIMSTKLYNLHLEYWKKEYIDHNIMDGTQWTVEIYYADGKVKEIYGSNKYPQNFEKLEKIFSRVK